MNSPLTSLSLTRLINARKHAPPNTRFNMGSLDQFPGMRLGPRRGQGLEFDDLRQYLPGDDIRHIDWNVTARTNQPHTRLYREDREHTTSVVVDLRPCMFTGSHILKAVKAAELAAITLWQAMYRGDRCSAVVFSQSGITATRPASMEKGVLRACELMANTFNTALSMEQKKTILIANSPARLPHPDADPEPELQALLDWLSRTGRRSGTHILFSGFDSFSMQSGTAPISALGKRKRLLPVLLLDALEIDGMPEGIYEYRTQARDRRLSLSKQTAEELQQNLQQSLRSLRELFTGLHIPLIEFDTRLHNTRFASLLSVNHNTS